MGDAIHGPWAVMVHPRDTSRDVASTCMSRIANLQVSPLTGFAVVSSRWL